MKFKPGDLIRYHAPSAKAPSEKRCFVTHIGHNQVDGEMCYFVNKTLTPPWGSIQYIPVNEPKVAYWALDKTGVEWMLELV